MIARGVLVLLLAAMAAAQLAGVGGFAGILRDYDVFGAAAGAIAITVPLVELASAAVVLVGGRLGGQLGLAVAIFWSALGAQAFARGLAIENCGCFGVWLGQELR